MTHGDGMGLYILRDGQPVRATSIAEWGEFQLSGRPKLNEEVLPDVHVSTVWLGADHRLTPGGAPVLWETMVFGGPHDGHQDRYTSAEDAAAGHQRIAAMVRGAGVDGGRP